LPGIFLIHDLHPIIGTYSVNRSGKMLATISFTEVHTSSCGVVAIVKQISLGISERRYVSLH
jgi:hypothetical protein